MIGQTHRRGWNIRSAADSSGRAHRIAAACIAICLLGAIASAPAHAAVEFRNPQPNMLVYRAPFVPRIAVPSGSGTLSVELTSNGVTTSISSSFQLCPSNIPPTSQGGACDQGEWVTVFSADPTIAIRPPLNPGSNTLHATWQSGSATQEATVTFEAYSRSYDLIPAAEPDRTFVDNCEILNDVSCLLPFPSSRFTVPDTSPGAPPGAVKVNLPSIKFLPIVNPDNPSRPLDPAPYNDADGFSPTAQILMHVPVATVSTGNKPSIDLAASHAPVLLPAGSPSSAPWANLRTIDGSSTAIDSSGSPTSPTLLLKVVGGTSGADAFKTELVPHWVELDAHAAGDPDHQMLILRPAQALTPGARYIVVVRNLKDALGRTLTPEPVYDVVRKTSLGSGARSTNIAKVIDRQVAYTNDIYPWIYFFPGFSQSPSGGKIDTQAVQLSFDFKVRSRDSLTLPGRILRDEAYDWLNNELAAGNPVFEVKSVASHYGFGEGFIGRAAWTVQGNIRTPNFLWKNPSQPVASNPEVEPTVASRLRADASGFLRSGDMWTPFTIDIPGNAIPSATNPNPVPAYPLIAGHGNFAGAFSMAANWQYNLGFPAPIEAFDHDYLAGAVNWRGYSHETQMPIGVTHPGNAVTDDAAWLLTQIIARSDGHGGVKSGLDDFPAWRDRVGQGIVNQLVFARLLKLGKYIFGYHSCFQTPPAGTTGKVWATSCYNAGFASTNAASLFPDAGATDVYYYGVSLGGGMGALLAGLAPDVGKLVLDVGGTNYSLALQRSLDYTYPTGSSVRVAIQSILGTDLTGADAGKDKAMNELVLIGVLHEAWVLAESAGYLDLARCAIHYDEQPYTNDCGGVWPLVTPKKVLLTPAWLDTHVSNQSSEVLARSLGLKQLEPASVQTSLVGISSTTSPTSDSALVTYSPGWWDAFGVLSTPSYLPPLGNDVPSSLYVCGNCTQHGRNPQINAYRRQMFNFLEPGGLIQSYCSGTCDGSVADERPAQGYLTCSGTNPPAYDSNCNPPPPPQ